MTGHEATSRRHRTSLPQRPAIIIESQTCLRSTRMKRDRRGRQGIVEPARLAMEEMSVELQTALWNVLHSALFDTSATIARAGRSEMAPLLGSGASIPSLTYQRIDLHVGPRGKSLGKWFFNESREWYEIYDLIDVLPSLFEHPEDRAALTQQLNQALQSEGSPYRFIEGQLTATTFRNGRTTRCGASFQFGRFSVCLDLVGRIAKTRKWSNPQGYRYDSASCGL
jgi:hypothetical protein